MKKQLFAISCVAAITFAAWSADNLIPNSFKDGATDWNFLSMKGKVKHLEQSSTKVNNGDHQGITMAFEVPDKENLIANKYGAWGRIHKILTLTPGKTYQVKTFAYPDKKFDGGISILVTAGDGTGTKQFWGDGQAYGKWQEIAGEFTATAPDAMIFLNAMGNCGEVSFDNVELFEVVPDTVIVKEQIVRNMKDLSSLKQSLVKINPIDPFFKEGLASFLKEYEFVNEKISHLKDFSASDLDQLGKEVDRLKMKAIFAYNLERFVDNIMATGIIYPLWNAGLNNDNAKNMIANSSFEYSTQDQLPDFWGCAGWGMADPYWSIHFEEWTQNFALDEATAYEGKKSMRIHNPFDRENKNGLCLTSNLLGTKTEVDYTLSAYMKGDPGMRVNFAGKEISLTGEWQRYVCPFVFKDGKDAGRFVLGQNAEADTIKIYPLCKGTFWVDAVQLEKSSEATSYENGVRCYLYPPHMKGAKVMTDVYSGMALQKWRTCNEDPLLIRPQYHIITSEKELTCKSLIGFQKDQLHNKRLQVLVKDAGGNEVVSQIANECLPSMNVTVKVAALSLGTYTLEAKLLNKEGAATASATCLFMKVPPQKDEAKIDRLSGIAIVNGKPFIPFGFYSQTATNTDDVRYLVENGFKTVDMTYVPGSKVMEEAMKEASTHEGVRIILRINLGNDIKQLQALVENIKALNQYPGFLGFNFTDEPIATGRCNELELQNMYDKIKAALPNKLVYMNDNLIGAARVLKHPDAPLGSDIISIDGYPVPSPFSSSSPSELFSMVYHAKMATATARRVGVPFWNVILCGGYAYGYSREYTPSEQEFNTYASIINGATGILYWAHHPKSKSHWEKIKAMAKEIEFLTPMIASQEAIPEVVCSLSQILLLTKVYDAKVYVMAVNSSLYPINAKIGLSGIKKSNNGTVKVLFEDRTVNFKDEVFEDRFEGHQRHVYVFNAF